MRRLSVCVAVAVCLAAATTALAVDTVKLVKGSTLRGKVVKTTATEVEIELTGGLAKTVPVNEIDAVYWEEEPPQFQPARALVKEGNYQAALTSIEKMRENLPKTGKLNIRQDLEFYAAYCRAQLALGGQGEIREAGTEMIKFVQNNPNSYQSLKANEMVGNLLVAMGAYDKAVTYYKQLEKMPWPDYKIRAAAAIGRSLLEQGQIDKAEEQFNAALAQSAEGDLAAAQRLLATLGKARCMAAKKKTDEAIKSIEELIDKADSEQSELLAQAYNALGNALLAANKRKEARMAFLHVKFLYNTNPDSHAEALANLARLWREENKPERAAQEEQILEERYKNSRWYKKS